MNDFQTTCRVHFCVIILCMLLYYDYGIAQFCNTINQNDDNTASFCKASKTSGSTVFIISAAPKYDLIHSCACIVEIATEVSQLSVSYNSGTATSDCGVKIDINGGLAEFTCVSKDLIFSSIRTIEFSRSSLTETHLCLEISTESNGNSTIRVNCSKAQNAGNENAQEPTDFTSTATSTDKKTSKFPATDGENIGKNDRKGPYKEKQNTNSNSALIGGIVGGVIGCLIIVIIVVIFICVRKRRRDRNERAVVRSDKQDGCNNSYDNTVQASDKYRSDKHHDVDDTAVTYNAMYNMDVLPNSHKCSELREKNDNKDTQFSYDDMEVTPNVMYNIHTPISTDNQYAVPNATHKATDDYIGDNRQSQLYHEIETGSSVA